MHRRKPLFAPIHKIEHAQDRLEEDRDEENVPDHTVQPEALQAGVGLGLGLDLYCRI